MQSPQRRRYDSSRVTVARGGRGDLSPLQGGKGRGARDYPREEWHHEPSYHRRRSSSPPVMQERRLRVTPPMADRGENHVYSSSRGLDDRMQQIEAQSLPYYSLSRGNIHHPSAPGHDKIHQPAPRYSNEDAAAVGYRHLQDSHLIRNHPADEHTGLARPLRIRDVHPAAEGPVMASSGMDIGGKNMFVRGSEYMDDMDISARMIVRPEPGSSQHTGLNGYIPGSIGATIVGSTSRYEIYKDEDLLHRSYVRDMYRGVDNEQVRNRDVPYPAEVPPMQPREFGSDSYIGLTKENILATYQEAPRIDRNVTNNFTDYRDQRILFDEHSRVQHLNRVNQQVPNPMVRRETEDGIYSDIARGERITNIRDQIPRHPEEDYSYREAFHSSYRDSLAEASPEATRKLNYWDHRASIQVDPEFDCYDNGREIEESMYEDEPAAFRTRLHQGHGFSHIRDEYGYETVDEMEAYRERSRSPIPSEQYEKVHYETRRIPRRRNDIEEVDAYDPQNDRLLRRRYIMDDEVDEGDPRRFTQTTGNVMRRIGKPNGISEPWRGKSRMNVGFVKRHGTGHSRFLLPHKASVSDAKFARRGPPGLYNDGLHTGLKRRLKMEPSDFQNSFQLSRKQDLSIPYKFQRKDQETMNESKATGEQDVANGGKYVKTDPPEGSEEFKHLAHKAFLRFSKILNENQHQREKYKEQGKAGSLLCFACGSLSKEFVDTHSLVMHAFNSLKIGLRTDHLGLHKALCVLMGWNHNVPPDGAKIYQSGPISEALSLKYDLIVWPPLVVIHNSSVGNKNMKGGPKVVTKEDVENILKGIGFGKGKFTGVCQGKPANNSVLLVKFSPTFSGLLEAEKLHNHYADHKHGREELEGVYAGKGSNETRDVSTLETKDLLYGYMATVEDLDELDPETKKRCVIKSKKDIEAIADAPLTAD